MMVAAALPSPLSLFRCTCVCSLSLLLLLLWSFGGLRAPSVHSEFSAHILADKESTEVAEGSHLYEPKVAISTVVLPPQLKDTITSCVAHFAAFRK